jgi:group II intron reverse transcriptase/maturase
MRDERREQQNLNLVTGSPSNSRVGLREQEEMYQSDMFPNRWTRISLKAQDKSFVFENLLTHFHVDSFTEAFKALDGSKALGVDGISKSEYGKSLKSNLLNLEKRIKSGSYRPQPKKEILIPKANGKTRPICISSFEDKIVDWVVSKVLTEIYEPMFIRNSFGYRPCKSADGAIRACYNSLVKNKRQNVVEIDFSSFFNTIPHRKLMNILGKKISDNKFKGLIGRFLRGDLISHDGEQIPSEIGTPQGSIMSPILANIYLNEVLDHWFIENYASHDNVIIRYADDAVFFFKKENTAEDFMIKLKERVELFGLELNKDKTHALKLTKDNHQSFDFLGFTFYWGKQGSRKILKVKTAKDKLLRAIREFEVWAKLSRSKYKLKEYWALAKSKITGHLNYYGYWCNSLKINHFHQEATRSLFKWLNRRSQKSSYTWEGFSERIKHFPLMASLDKIKYKKLGYNIYEY